MSAQRQVSSGPCICSLRRRMLYPVFPAACRNPASGASRIQAGACITSPDPSAVTDAASMARNRLVLVVYTSAIFVSALLLFSVQPLFTKMVLPRLGGGPAGWAGAGGF